MRSVERDEVRERPADVDADLQRVVCRFRRDLFARKTGHTMRPQMRPKPLVFRMLRWSLLVVPLACNSLADSVKRDPNFTVDPRKTVELLASDAFEGRG